MISATESTNTWQACSFAEMERALGYTGTWYDAIRARDLHLIRALIHVRGARDLRRQVAILHHAVTDADAATLHVLIANGCDVNAPDTVKSKVTPLMEAVRRGDLCMCELLLDSGASVDGSDACGENVMHWAARYTSGTFFKRFVALAEKKGMPKSQLQALASAMNGKKATALQVARTPTLQSYIHALLHPSSASVAKGKRGGGGNNRIGNYV